MSSSAGNCGDINWRPKYLWALDFRQIHRTLGRKVSLNPACGKLNALTYWQGNYLPLTGENMVNYILTKTAILLEVGYIQALAECDYRNIQLMC